MKISTKSRYGLRFMIYLARNSSRAVQLGEVSAQENVSLKYLGIIAGKLRTCGLVNSWRGAHGGYTLANGARSITVKDIVACLEGDFVPVDCIKSAGCSRQPECAAREVWKILGEGTAKVYASITLRDIVEMHPSHEGSMNYAI